jgi:hypothetical protein
MIIVSLVILLFLWHFPSAIIPIVTIPIAVFLSFIPMYGMKLTANIMSLSGIAISIGVLVDGAIVEVENAYRKLELWQQGGRKGDFHTVRLEALKEVGPSVFFSLLVIAVAFLPVFTLVDQEGRLFKPLAYSKNLAMAIAAVLAITLDPAIRMLFTRMDYHRFRPRPLAWLYNTLTVGRYYPEEKHPVSRVLFAVYEQSSPVDDHRSDSPDGGHGARVLSLGFGIHAAIERGHDPLHADDAAGHLRHGGGEPAADPGQDPDVGAGGGARVRKGRPRQYAHGPGALFHDGDDGCSQG